MYIIAWYNSLIFYVLIMWILYCNKKIYFIVFYNVLIIFYDQNFLINLRLIWHLAKYIDDKIYIYKVFKIKNMKILL